MTTEELELLQKAAELAGQGITVWAREALLRVARRQLARAPEKPEGIVQDGHDLAREATED